MEYKIGLCGSVCIGDIMSIDKNTPIGIALEDSKNGEVLMQTSSVFNFKVKEETDGNYYFEKKDKYKIPTINREVPKIVMDR